MIDYTQLSPWLWVVAPVAVVLAYTVFGLSGFGSTLISVPLLAHFLPLSFLVPLMAIIDLASSLVIGTRGREQVSRSELKALAPFMFVGLVVGATMLVGFPDKWLRAALGIFAAAVGVYSMVNPTLNRAVSRLWCIPTGLVGGVAGTIFGAGGPVYATYLSGRLSDKGELRATISSLISISAFARTLAYALAGLVHLATAVAIAALAPFAALGMWLGHRIHVGLTQTQMRRAVGAILVLAGASLLVRVAMT
jgi:uncharacterized protein